VAPARTQAQQEAEALATVSLLDSARQALLTSDNPTERNTGQLFAGPKPRLTCTPMTLRSDSAAILAARGKTPGSQAYYFTGTVQEPWDGVAAVPAGTFAFGPTMVGTISGDEIRIRGKAADGSWRSDDDLRGTMVHESSHVLVRAYDTFPQSKPDAGSFDRYKDEFRAYWVETRGKFVGLAPEDKWKAIRDHLVGGVAYPELAAEYAKAGGTFETQVNAHHAPEGYNLTNSPRLDALFTKLHSAVYKGTPSPGELVAAVLALEPAERAEAQASTLIDTLVGSLPLDVGTRVRAVLANPPVTAFRETLALNHADDIKATYQALPAATRGELAYDPAMWVFIDHHVREPAQRACVYAMVVTTSVRQYAAMWDFLEACFLARIEADTSVPSGPPPDLIAALRGLAPMARMVLGRAVDDTRRIYVDTLPPPIRQPVLAVLRGDRDP
jgi:hypothetical protein